MGGLPEDRGEGQANAQAKPWGESIRSSIFIVCNDSYGDVTELHISSKRLIIRLSTSGRFALEEDEFSSRISIWLMALCLFIVVGRGEDK